MPLKEDAMYYRHLDPMAPDPPAVSECSECGEPIREGDEFYGIEGEPMHAACVEDNALELLLQVTGAKKRTAERDGAWAPGGEW